MIKDPFDNIPSIPPEDYREPQPSARHPETAPVHEDVTRGTAPRNVAKSVPKFGIPLLGIAILVWIMLPNQPAGVKKSEIPDADVDQTRQIAQTDAMMEQMRREAKKVPEPKPVETPPVTPIGPQGVKPVSPLPPAESAELAKLKAEQERREQEIRASSLEAGAFKLASDTGSGSGLASSIPKPSASTEADARIAATSAARSEAMRSQEAQVRSMAAAFQPKDAPKSRGNNGDFFTEQAGNTSNDVLRQQQSAARYILNQGTVIRTVLLSAINSDSPGQIRAQVTSDVYDSTYMRHVLIPKGSFLVGAYNSQVSIGQARVVAAMNRLILPNGTWISLAAAPGTDMTGQAGLEADVDNHFLKMFGSSLVLGMASWLLPSDKGSITTTQGLGGTTTGGSIGAMALNDTLKILLERNKNIAPTLTVPLGQEFSFMAAKDMAMSPYRP